jgi:hypothetical protein
MSTTIKATKNNVSVECQYDFGESLEEMKQKFGEEVVFSNAKQAITISIQALMRRKIEKGETEEAICQAVAEYVPGLAGERQDPVEKFKSRWANLSKEEREKLLDQLKQMG